MASTGEHWMGRHGERRLSGRHVLAVMLVFLAVVFAVNAAMIYAALSTYSGVVAAEPYRKGLHYNDRILAEERQRLRNWREALTIEPDGRITLAIAGANAEHIGNLSVDVAIGRPSTNREDVKLRLVADAGRYRGQIAPLPPGAWIVALEARSVGSGGEPIFRARKRLWVAP
jgi:nitrogen fixation protein FixH